MSKLKPEAVTNKHKLRQIKESPARACPNAGRRATQGSGGMCRPVVAIALAKPGDGADDVPDIMIIAAIRGSRGK